MASMESLYQEIERLNNIIELKDGIIKKYEDAIRDVGAKLDIIEKKCSDSGYIELNQQNEKTKAIIYHTIEFPKYQFAYKTQVQEFKNNLESAIYEYKMVEGERIKKTW